MITIKVNFNKEGLITGYKVEGHAGLAEAGKDILCAAVSAITQTPILGLERHLKRHPCCQVTEGTLKVELDKVDEATQTLLATMLCGLQDLTEKYPENVRIEEQR